MRRESTLAYSMWILKGKNQRSSMNRQIYTQKTIDLHGGRCFKGCYLMKFFKKNLITQFCAALSILRMGFLRMVLWGPKCSAVVLDGSLNRCCNCAKMRPHSLTSTHSQEHMSQFINFQKNDAIQTPTVPKADTNSKRSGYPV
jgi:hypothetical protein